MDCEARKIMRKYTTFKNKTAEEPTQMQHCTLFPSLLHPPCGWHIGCDNRHLLSAISVPRDAEHFCFAQSVAYLRPFEQLSTDPRSCIEIDRTLSRKDAGVRGPRRQPQGRRLMCTDACLLDGQNNVHIKIQTGIQ